MKSQKQTKLAEKLSAPYMRGVWRDEIRILTASERKIRRDFIAHRRRLRKEIRAIEHSFDRANRNCGRELHRIQQRRAILQGRLS